MAMAAIADRHVSFKHPNPCADPSLKVLMQGIKRQLGKPAVQAEGFTRGQVKGMINLAIGTHLDGVKAVPLIKWREAWREMVSFMGQTRFSDLRGVRKRDVYFEGNMVRIDIQTRKNDQRHVGHSVFLFESGTRYCPVRITRMYLALLPLDPDCLMLPSLSKDFKTPASYASCRNQQKALLLGIGIDPTPYGLHSGRVGGCKCLKDANMSRKDMAEIVGWAEKSKQPDHYSKTAMAKHLKTHAAVKL
jgi:integrase